jgi:hypothetical protein
LQVGVKRGYVSRDEIGGVERRYDEIGRMLAGLIDHLRESDWKDRRR